MMDALRRYWFAPAKCFDLAVVRIIAVATQLILLYAFADHYGKMVALAELPDDFWDPLLIMNFLHLPFGWGVRPGLEVVQSIYWLSVIAGVFSLVGLSTNLSLGVFAVTSIYLQAFFYSYGDYHHPEAVMMIALAVLARWPLKLLQWFFALMYISAVASKLSAAGLDWANGFTLQYYLARDGLRWGSELAVLMSRHHDLIMIGQIGVLLFQATFSLAVLFPVLRWVYVPAGLTMHPHDLPDPARPVLPMDRAVRRLHPVVGGGAAGARAPRRAPGGAATGLSRRFPPPADGVYRARVKPGVRACRNLGRGSSTTGSVPSARATSPCCACARPSGRSCW
ncbi:MAG TPA: hypothetical protein VFZ01_20145 [Geminicoccaceae bacterium]